MAAVAALSVRRLHPQARIVLVTDEPTARAIDRRSHALRNIVSEMVVRPTGTNDLSSVAGTCGRFSDN
jgi:hypothetical protein